MSVRVRGKENTQEWVSWLPGLRSLRQLTIVGSRLKDDDLRYVAGLTQLECLDIQENAITDKGLAYLKSLHNLQTLIHSEPVGRDGIDILAALPSLKMEYLKVNQVAAHDLKRFKQLSEIRQLDISHPVGDDWATAMAVCTNLQALDLTDASLSDQQLIAIVQANPLTMLYLTDVPVGESILPFLHGRTELTRLGLMRTGVSYEKMLEHLGTKAGYILLSDNAIMLLDYGETGRQLHWEGELPIEKIGALEYCQECIHLRVQGESYQGCDLSFLCEMPLLEGVTFGFPLTDEDLKAISRASKLKDIQLTGPQQVTPQGIAYLRNLPQLESMDLYDAGLTDAHFKGIGEIRTLNRFSVFVSKITSNGMAHLCQLQSLERLSLYDCESLDDAALPHIAKLNSLSGLQFKNVPITDQGLPCLYGMPNLIYVSLDETNCTAEGEQALDKMLPSYIHEGDPYFFEP